MSAATAVPGRSRARSVATVLAYGVLIVLALVAVLSAFGRPADRTPGVMTDALGPDSGEAVAAYVERASASLSEDGDERSALVTFRAPLTTDDAAQVSRSLPRVSRVYAQSPVDGVAMPVLWADLPEPVEGAGRADVLQMALHRVAEHPVAEVGREGRARRLTDARILAGEPVVVAVLTHASPGSLRQLSSDPAVRAVEALPSDAVWGRFAVRPLLPQHVDVVSPLRDDAEVPEP